MSQKLPSLHLCLDLAFRTQLDSAECLARELRRIPLPHTPSYWAELFAKFHHLRGFAAPECPDYRGALAVCDELVGLHNPWPEDFSWVGLEPKAVRKLGELSACLLAVQWDLRVLALGLQPERQLDGELPRAEWERFFEALDTMRIEPRGGPHHEFIWALKSDAWGLRKPPRLIEMAYVVRCAMPRLRTAAHFTGNPFFEGDPLYFHESVHNLEDVRDAIHSDVFAFVDECFRGIRHLAICSLERSHPKFGVSEFGARLEYLGLLVNELEAKNTGEPAGV